VIEEGTNFKSTQLELPGLATHRKLSKKGGESVDLSTKSKRIARKYPSLPLQLAVVSISTLHLPSIIFQPSAASTRRGKIICSSKIKVQA
jgi:hypothetical protein